MPLDQCRRDKDYHAHEEHDKGDLQGAELPGGPAAEHIVSHIAYQGHQQAHKAQQADAGFAAGLHQGHAAHAGHSAQDLQLGDGFVADEYICQNADYRHHCQHRACDGGGGIADAAVFKHQV